MTTTTNCGARCRVEKVVLVESPEESEQLEHMEIDKSVSTPRGTSHHSAVFTLAPRLSLFFIFLAYSFAALLASLCNSRRMSRSFSIDSLLARKSTNKKHARREENSRIIRVFLQSSSLWCRFHSLGTEMIVTKSGRRMFPTLSVIIAGLDPVKQYVVMVDLECIEMKRFRYSFHQSKWISTGPGESELPSRMFVHSDSPARGAHWMRAPVSFDKMKLTNNQMDSNGHIIVNSMHKYRPRVHIIEQDNSQKRHVFSFEETEFIAVTAYQNHRITSLKIESNPFAKGFRECEVQGIEMGNIGVGGPTLHSVFPLIFPYFANFAANVEK